MDSYEASYMYFNEVITRRVYRGHAAPGEEPALGDLVALEHRVRSAGNSPIGAETGT